MTCDCDREQDVLDALAAGRWPARCDDDLRAHVDACMVCRDLADVASAVAEDRDRAWGDVQVPSSGIMWWRVQLRAREDAARAAGRPVAFIQGVAASVAVWLAIALFRAIPAQSLGEWRAWLVGGVAITMADVARLTAAVPLLVFVIVGAWLLLAPIAIYFVADE